MAGKLAGEMGRGGGGARSVIEVKETFFPFVSRLYISAAAVHCGQLVWAEEAHVVWTAKDFV